MCSSTKSTTESGLRISSSLGVITQQMAAGRHSFPTKIPSKIFLSAFYVFEYVQRMAHTARSSWAAAVWCANWWVNSLAQCLRSTCTVQPRPSIRETLKNSSIKAWAPC